MKCIATFTPVAWDEKMYEQPTPPTKLTKASVKFDYSGQMQGQGLVEYIMFYASYDDRDPHKASAEYVGLINFKGTLDGKAGTFVMEDRGTFSAGSAESTLRILPGSGTDQLAGISGGGTSKATQSASECELNVELP